MQVVFWTYSVFSYPVIQMYMYKDQMELDNKQQSILESFDVGSMRFNNV